MAPSGRTSLQKREEGIFLPIFGASCEKDIENEKVSADIRNISDFKINTDERKTGVFSGNSS